MVNQDGIAPEKGDLNLYQYLPKFDLGPTACSVNCMGKMRSVNLRLSYADGYVQYNKMLVIDVIVGDWS